MQDIKKNFYVVESGRATMHDKDFATKHEAIQYCIHERELDYKVGAMNNYYEVFSYKDKGVKLQYTTKGVIYKFMRPQVVYDYTKRCEFGLGCTKYICGKGSGKLCAEHYEKIMGNVEGNVNRAINKVETKIDVAKAISNSIK